jgi:hypothetical protein
MPTKVRKHRGKYRVVEQKTGRTAKNKGGRTLDGGGHKDKDKARRQSNAINAYSPKSY